MEGIYGINKDKLYSLLHQEVADFKLIGKIQNGEERVFST